MSIKSFIIAVIALSVFVVSVPVSMAHSMPESHAEHSLHEQVGHVKHRADYQNPACRNCDTGRDECYVKRDIPDKVSSLVRVDHASSCVRDMSFIPSWHGKHRHGMAHRAFKHRVSKTKLTDRQRK